MKRTRFYLIQRGQFRNNLSEATGFLGGRNECLINPDYMGSAEFEWGAIPKAYRRIHGRFDKYKLHITDLVTTGGVPFCLYCLDNRYEEILEAIKVYLKEKYKLKEWTNMEAHFDTNTPYDIEHRKYQLKTNFWWCIDSTTSDDDDRFAIGDWIAFTGATDRQNAFMRVISYDNTDWWKKKTPEEQNSEYTEAFKRW